jgi:hypothetical protein
VGVNWKFRGVGYMYTKLRMVLAARVVVAVAVAAAAPPPGAEPDNVPPTRTTVQIFNVYDTPFSEELVNGTSSGGNTSSATGTRIETETSRAKGDVHNNNNNTNNNGGGGGGGGGDGEARRGTRRRDDCDRLTLWVRAYGPEIFAGTAKAVPATDSDDCYWTFDFLVRVGAGAGWCFRF